MRGRNKIILALVVLSLLFTVSPAMAAEAGGSPLDALGINPGFLISQIVNFLIVLVIVRAFLWKPMMNMLDARSATIQKGLEDAAAAANARRNAEAEAEKILAQARIESQQVIAEARERAEQVARGIQNDAQSEGDRIRAEAQLRIEEDRNRELGSLRGQVAAISTAIARQLIGETLDETRQQRIVTDFFTRLPAGATDLNGTVTVTSAMPLTDAEKDRIRQALPNATDLTYNVNPAILGGVVIRSGDRVIDGSVRSGLNDISARLN